MIKKWYDEKLTASYVKLRETVITVRVNLNR